MSHKDKDIFAKDAPNLIRKLKRFLGTNKLEGKIKKYLKSLESAGYLYANYYLRNRHPWWDAFVLYDELERTGKSIPKNLTEPLIFLISYAKKISVLQKNMPLSIREKFKRDLIKDDNPRGFLFEIDIAWHFHLREFKIKWYEDLGENRPEFCVKSPEYEFDVECKTINVNTFRKIRRQDFYYFVDIIIPAIQEKDLMGNIYLTFNNRLPKDIKKLRAIVVEIVEFTVHGSLQGEYKTTFGEVSLNLTPADNRPVNFGKLEEELRANKPHEAHAVIYAKSLHNDPVNPISITCISKKASNVLKGLRKKLGQATLKQLDQSKPGLLACFIPEIDDFAGLERHSGLENMTYDLFAKQKKKRDHILAVTYSSEAQYIQKNYGKKSNYPGVVFRNPFCKFDNFSQYNFLDK